MKLNRLTFIVVSTALAVAPAFAQDKATQNTAAKAPQSTAAKAPQNTNVTKMATGQKTKVAGIILKREADTFYMRDLNGGDVQVVVVRRDHEWTPQAGECHRLRGSD